MNSLPTRAILVAGTATLVASVAALGSVPLAIGILSATVSAAVAHVALASQSERLRDSERLVYRPVYVRSHDARRRVSSDD